MGSDRTDRLVDRHDLLLLDLDGVVYVGPEAVPGAPDHLSAAREAGVRLAFVTNNAGRTPEEVAAHLTSLGVAADPGDVVTSAQAAARILAERLGPGARVFLLGSPALARALTEEGLVPVDAIEDDPQAVASGYGPDVAWRTILAGASLVAQGTPWVACNADLTFPLPTGLAPGHGALVDMISRFSGATPLVAGKPGPRLFDEAVRRMGAVAPLVVGDRLDTDIAGAHAANLPSLLVLTGVTDRAVAAAAGPDEWPTYVADDLSALLSRGLHPQAPPGATPGGADRDTVEP
ncbi:HAD-IIA family hydrolase [Nocardioides sp. AE5]|uniref:HAD-IIA family hydrolase n=1 Tax=Nocardioides sp. AE5 TaxID=2962573 RepID=UPI002881CC73|nr:HAD-IIA family hydrolase [Nocardioides sp. AE5]MDT0201544.1 HAD-IIA family hydrolase [Nocardioides sp. AE5]